MTQEDASPAGGAQNDDRGEAASGEAAQGPDQALPAAGPTPRSRSASRWRWIGGSMLVLVLATGAAAGAAALWLRELADHTPGIEQVQAVQVPRPSIVRAADGSEIARIASAYQDPVPLERVSPHVVQALLATEDRRFHEHRGIDPRRIVAAAWNTLRGRLEGASTLTQQLARNLFPREIGRERSLTRKLKEAIVALRIERAWDKRRILETYLNTAPFLYNVRGIEMAARSYFGKPAAQLDELESATLVGMLKGSERYNPLRNPERARERRNLVLGRMVANGALPAGRLEALRAQPLGIEFQRPVVDSSEARHFLGYVRAELDEWADRNDVDPAAAGLVIETTLDLKLQRLAQAAVSEQVAYLQRVAEREWSEPAQRRKAGKADEKTGAEPAAAEAPFPRLWRERAGVLAAMLRETPRFKELRAAGRSDEAALRELLADTAFVRRLQQDKTQLSAGFVALDPRSGEVKAWIGSPDFERDQFDHVAQARRQPGSTFKPFVYGAALMQGMSREQTFVDETVSYTAPDGSLWQPTDMGGPTGALFTLNEGLAQSRNTITAQVMQSVGPPAVVAFARAAGVVEAPLEPVPSLALGTSPVSLLEMAGAYATLAALGEQRRPVVIRRILDANGQTLASAETGFSRTLDRGIVERLVDMMRGVVDGGTAAPLRSRFGVRGDVAGKTGTTQNNTDGWFIAMQPTLVTGAWVGFNDQRVSMRTDYWGQGAHTALRLVGDFLKRGQLSGDVDRRKRFPKVQPDPVPQPALPPVVDDPAAAAMGGGGRPPTPLSEVLWGVDSEGRPMATDRAGAAALLRETFASHGGP